MLPTGQPRFTCLWLETLVTVLQPLLPLNKVSRLNELLSLDTCPAAQGFYITSACFLAARMLCTTSPARQLGSTSWLGTLLQPLDDRCDDTPCYAWASGQIAGVS